MSNNLTPSFRVPPNLAGVLPSAAVEVIQRHDNGIVDLNQAIVSLKSQIDALKPSTTTGTTSTTTNITTATENTVVVSGSTIGGINNLIGVTSYSTQQSDYGLFLFFNDASAVAVTLTTGPAIQLPWFCWITNFGAGTVTLTPASGTINGNATQAILQNQYCGVVYDGTNFATTESPTAPQNTPAVTHEWLASYSSSTGAFTQTRPAFADISGNLATGQLPTAGISVTITTAALTGGGTQGSQTFTNGVLTAQVQAT